MFKLQNIQFPVIKNVEKHIIFIRGAITRYLVLHFNFINDYNGVIIVKIVDYCSVSQLIKQLMVLALVSIFPAVRI